MRKDNPVIILGAFETALGVARSLGRSGIKSICLDFKKDICFYSRYSKGFIVPHPLTEEEKFLEFILNNNFKSGSKSVFFITSDDFLKCISVNYEKIKNHYLINISDKEVINTILNKYKLYLKCEEIGINVPKTYLLKNESDIETVISDIPDYPLFLKGLNVNDWRKYIHGSVKGYVVNNKIEFINKSKEILNKKVEIIAQEIIQGGDKNHFKCCVYIDRNGNELLNFTLRKLIQNPVHFGVGAIVESCEYPELKETGSELFKKLNYRGVGSAEFKLDDRDGKLKLIEINPRYWQQNYLPTVCGMNFPLVDYLELTGQNPEKIQTFNTGIKWVNRYMSLDSFLAYKKEGELTFSKWIKLSKGKKTYSDIIFNDPLPMFYEFGFGKKLFNLPKYLIKRIKRN